MATVLGANQYGKAENRVVRIVRDTPRHEIRDLNVSSSLRGEFSDAHITGDQVAVLPTDTQKNTAFAYAKLHGVDSIEDYALALGRRLVDACPAASEARCGSRSTPGTGSATTPSCAAAAPSAPAWSPSAATRPTCCPASGAGAAQLHRLGVQGFLKDEFTTLAETDDRILATSLIAKWRHAGTEVDWNASYDAVTATC